MIPNTMLVARQEILLLRNLILTSVVAVGLFYLPAALAEPPSLAVADTTSRSSAPGVTQLLTNPGFEAGESGWTGTEYDFAVNSRDAAHQGNYVAWMGGAGWRHVETLYQGVSIPAHARARLSFWIDIDTDETTRRHPNDRLYVQVRTPAGHVLRTLATYSNLNRTHGYVQKTFDLSHFAGRDVQLFLKVVEDNGKQSSFFLDDVNLTVE